MNTGYGGCRSRNHGSMNLRAIFTTTVRGANRCD